MDHQSTFKFRKLVFTCSKSTAAYRTANICVYTFLVNLVEENTQMHASILTRICHCDVCVREQTCKYFMYTFGIYKISARLQNDDKLPYM